MDNHASIGGGHNYHGPPFGTPGNYSHWLSDLQSFLDKFGDGQNNNWLHNQGGALPWMVSGGGADTITAVLGSGHTSDNGLSLFGSAFANSIGGAAGTKDALLAGNANSTLTGGHSPWQTSSMDGPAMSSLFAGQSSLSGANALADFGYTPPRGSGDTVTLHDNSKITFADPLTQQQHGTIIFPHG